ncbi:CpsD/CapB family tyrosine-protein kinase [Planococcus sp. APC 3906]|uniref:CpsD/CapB family tyrosine-protein kinase n=1 Tax=Planococcus sp. APC 3906 TaxID=3035194 RepID=UPI0025B5227A|nr:CpsD/CapB family tyrosine-protein kinase [Planococcus sp. APC 3906]MDN3450099.1 CpsD/CapB family tyrosine-protein kinase [Planococcus sp. APC 3906]
MVKQINKTEYSARRLITANIPNSYIAEQFRTLRTNINFASPDHKIRTLVITSASPFEGKSTAAANLAIVFAQEGKKVLLIDADMRKPTMHYTFNKENNRGLSSVLTRQASIQDVVMPSGIERLHLLTSGPIPPNPAELLASLSLQSIIKKLEDQYDLVIFDSPPILSVTDGQILANKCDGVVLVINSGKTQKKKAQKAKEAIVASNGKLLGAVLNNFQLPKNDLNQYYYHH